MIYTEQGTYTITWHYNDGHGNESTQTQTVIVRDTTPPLITLNGSSTVTVECHGSYIDPGATAIDNCSGDLSAAVVATSSVNTSEPGAYAVTYNVTDKAGNPALPATRTVLVVNTAPLITGVTGPANPVALGSAATVSASFSDAEASQTHSATFTWGDGITESVSVAAGLGIVTRSHTYGSPGVYSVGVKLADSCGLSATSLLEYIVIYEPSGAFVTGGGWINSPAGAYRANPSLATKASFGFVAKYAKGSSAPAGQTQFQLHSAGFDFQSTAYDWFVTSGPRAQYKGSGTINRAGDYGFTVTAVDGQATGGGGYDRLRMKIWDKGTGAVIYDNQAGADETAPLNDGTNLGGGSVVIQKQ